MSEKTTKQSFLNFIFKETVLSGNFWPREGEGRRHHDVPPAAVTRGWRTWDVGGEPCL